jgi:hypothetical protein
MTMYNIKDQYGQDVGLRPEPGYITQVSLAANVAERIAVPTGKTVVIFGGTASFWAKPGDSSVTATVGTDVSDGTAAELNPSGWRMLTSTHISIISPTSGCIVNMVWESLV